MLRNEIFHFLLLQFIKKINAKQNVSKFQHVVEDLIPCFPGAGGRLLMFVMKMKSQTTPTQRLPQILKQDDQVLSHRFFAVSLIGMINVWLNFLD